MQNDMRDRLVELLKSKTAPWEYLLCKSNIETLADYLIANGVIISPCKVGDKVYIIDLFNYEPCKNSGECGDVCPHLYAEYGFGYECSKGHCGAKLYSCAEIKVEIIEDISQIFSYWDWFGKTVFLTKEEAEQKLKEMTV